MYKEVNHAIRDKDELRRLKSLEEYLSRLSGPLRRLSHKDRTALCYGADTGFYREGYRRHPPLENIFPGFDIWTGDGVPPSVVLVTTFRGKYLKYRSEEIGFPAFSGGQVSML